MKRRHQNRHGWSNAKVSSSVVTEGRTELGSTNYVLEVGRELKRRHRTDITRVTLKKQRWRCVTEDRTELGSMNNAKEVGREIKRRHRTDTT